MIKFLPFILKFCTVSRGGDGEGTRGEVSEEGLLDRSSWNYLLFLAFSKREIVIIDSKTDQMFIEQSPWEVLRMWPSGNEQLSFQSPLYLYHILSFWE